MGMGRRARKRGGSLGGTCVGECDCHGERLACEVGRLRGGNDDADGVVNCWGCWAGHELERASWELGAVSEGEGRLRGVSG